MSDLKTDIARVQMVVDQALLEMEARLEQKLKAYLDGRQEQEHTRDAWCCVELEAFAHLFETAESPRLSDEATWERLSINGVTFRWCPFCGVKL